MKRLFALVCFLLLAAHGASAETRSAAYAAWNVVGGNVRVLYTLPVMEAKNLSPPNTPGLTTKQIADYLLSHLGVERGRNACPILDQGEDIGKINTLALVPGYLRFEIVFQCADGNGLTLTDSAFADRMADHVEYARVQIDNGGFVQHIFTAATQHFVLPTAANALASDSWIRYAGFGLLHVWRSPEILCFVLALLLLARRRADYALGLAALIAGYAVATALSVFDLVAARAASSEHGLLLAAAAAAAMAFTLPDPRRALSVIGLGGVVLAGLALYFQGLATSIAVLSITLIAVSALFLPNSRQRNTAVLLIAPFLFALLDGFTLPAGIAYLDLAPAQAAPMVAGFNLGVLFSAIAPPLCLIGAALFFPKLKRAATVGGFGYDLTASLFIGCGVFWYGSWLLVR